MTLTSSHDKLLVSHLPIPTKNGMNSTKSVRDIQKFIANIRASDDNLTKINALLDSFLKEFEEEIINKKVLHAKLKCEIDNLKDIVVQESKKRNSVLF